MNRMNRKLAEDPNTTSEQLKVLATDNDCDLQVLDSVAQHPNTLPETLELLANDEDEVIRYLVAINPNTPPEALQLLATDDDCDIRYYAAHNPNATEIVRRLYLMTEAQSSS